jgi:hypothetical protein
MPWWKSCRSVAYFDLPDSRVVGLDPKRLVELACGLGADVIGLRAAGTSAWYRTVVEHQPSVFPDEGPDFLRDLIVEAREADLQVVVGVDFGVASEMVLRLRPEWFARDDSGQPRALGEGRYRVCPLAEFRGEAVALPVMRELAAYGLDGIVIHGATAPLCRCGDCRRTFQQVAGTDLPSLAEENPSALTEWYHWLWTTASAGTAAQIQALEIDGERPMVVVEMLGIATTENERTEGVPIDLHRHGDVLLIRDPDGTDGRKTPVWVHGVRARHGLTLSAERAVWVEMPSVGSSGGKKGLAVDSGISILAAGGTLWNSFDWLVDSDDPILPVLAGLAKQGESIRTRLGGAVDSAPVTLVWPEGPGDGEGIVPPAAREEFFGFAQAFVSHGVPFAVLPGHLLEVDRLEPYRALALPSATALSDRQMHAIRRFVGAGGGLLASFTTGLNDAAGNARRQWDLADMVNASFAGHVLELGADYVTVLADHAWLKAGLSADFEIPAEHRQVILRVPEGTDVPMELEYRGEARELMTGIPFLLSSGDSRVFLFAGEIGRIVGDGDVAGAGRLLANVVRRAIEEDFEVDLRAAPNVELRTFKDGHRVFAYLQRHDASGRRGVEVAVGLTFREDARPPEAYLVAAGSPAQLELADGCAWAIVPELQGWELVEFVFPD